MVNTKNTKLKIFPVINTRGTRQDIFVVFFQYATISPNVIVVIQNQTKRYEKKL